MHVDRRFLNWGIFFILLGAVPLAVQANLLDRAVVARSWQLWPLLLIGAGVALILRRTQFDFVGGLIAAATFGLILGGLVAVGTDFSSFGRACGGDTGKAFATQQGTLSSGRVDIEFNCGDLTVSTAPGSAWALSGVSANGEVPRLDASANQLAIRSRDGGGFVGFGARQAWSAVLPADPTLDVDVQVNAGSGALRFDGAHLGAVTLQGNAGSTTIDLGSAASVARLDVHVNAGSARISAPNATLTGTFGVNAGTISFCVPEGVGVRITGPDNLTAANNFAERGLTRVGASWESSNYAAASNRFTITASANAGSLTLNPREGCR